MINKEDQDILFKLIADKSKIDMSCMAVGGTAMMFQNYKGLTKDIDLIFFNEKERDEFIRIIKEIGYEQKSIVKIYSEKKAKDPDKPLLFSRGDERIDIFLRNIFGIIFDEKAKDNIVERRDFIGNKEFRLYVPPIEYIVLLKAITNREKDYEDIISILKIEKNIDWDLITDIAISQRKNKEWVIIDIEETMKKLKKEFFIPEKYFKKLYGI